MYDGSERVAGSQGERATAYREGAADDRLAGDNDRDRCQNEQGIAVVFSHRFKDFSPRKISKESADARV